jgi:hypothetical protein
MFIDLLLLKPALNSKVMQVIGHKIHCLYHHNRYIFPFKVASSCDSITGRQRRICARDGDPCGDDMIVDSRCCMPRPKIFLGVSDPPISSLFKWAYRPSRAGWLQRRARPNFLKARRRENLKCYHNNAYVPYDYGH